MKPVLVLAAGLLVIGGCTRREDHRVQREEHTIQKDGDTAARKAGRAAYRIADEMKDTAKKAGREIKKTTKEAAAGWKEEREAEKSRSTR